MPRYKLTFEFDGTDFSGWQIQPDARTVEKVVEDAFSQLFNTKIDIAGQGRTDAGVHAEGQTAHADLPDTLTPGKILHAMKGLLPGDVSLVSIEAVHNDFHARFDAISRQYCYRVIRRKSPLNRHYTWYVYDDPDIALLDRCAGEIVGEHNFVNFCIPPEDEHMTTICNITESRWKEHGDELRFIITGDRFLRHMVRRLTGAMIQVATGRESFEGFQELLSGRETSSKAFSAPSSGLTLKKVSYK
jgi:tRNA pseudouridine38-40 synthase